LDNDQKPAGCKRDLYFSREELILCRFFHSKLPRQASPPFSQAIDLDYQVFKMAEWPSGKTLKVDNCKYQAKAAGLYLPKESLFTNSGDRYSDTCPV